MKQPEEHKSIDDYAEITEDIIRQRNWTEEELKDHGYHYYERRKQITMARKLPDDSPPVSIINEHGETLVAQPGYIICYEAGERAFDTLDEYPHWPVEPGIFARTYKRWEEEDWEPDPAEKRLIELGCRPYYKSVGVWAKKLTEDVLLQSIEHTEPVKVKTGSYIAIGMDGEPYHIGERTLHSRYVSSRRRLLNWFKRLFGLN
jgi:hypothetical protein